MEGSIEIRFEIQDLRDSVRVERTIDVHVRNLRAKIEPDPANPGYIETVFGVGYRFRAALDTLKDR